MDIWVFPKMARRSSCRSTTPCTDRMSSLRIGEGLFQQVDCRLVAFQVDGTTPGGVEGDQRPQIWSVLVQGLALEDGENVRLVTCPHPEVVDPGRRVVRIRADVVTGRRFAAAPTRQ